MGVAPHDILGRLNPIVVNLIRVVFGSDDQLVLRKLSKKGRKCRGGGGSCAGLQEIAPG